MEKFNYEENGYNRREVNEFVKDVITQTEAVITRCKLQAKEIEVLTKELNHYKNLDITLNETLKKIEDKSKIMAEKEAELIIIKAKENANRIVNEALVKAERLENTSKELEHNIKKLKIRLNSIIEEQKSIIEDIELI